MSLVRVLHVTPECAPMTKTGGLGDVSAALPAALRASGVDAMTLLPGYPAVLDHVGRAPEAARLTLLGFQCRLLRPDPLLVPPWRPPPGRGAARLARLPVPAAARGPAHRPRLSAALRARRRALPQARRPRL